MASYTRYLVHAPQSPTEAITASTPLIQSLNSPSRSFSREDTEKERALNMLILTVGNLSFKSFSVTSRRRGAARLLLHSRPIFLPSSLSSRGERPLSGTGSASAQGLSTSYEVTVFGSGMMDYLLTKYRLINIVIFNIKQFRGKLKSGRSALSRVDIQ